MQKDIPLSGNDLKKMISEMNERPNIIFGKNLNENSTINDIFPNNSGHCIIFHDWGSSVGHWIACTRQHKKDKNNNYEKEGDFYFFDSFAKSPNYYNKHIAGTALKTYPKIHYNDIKIQADDANTCGRHCVFISSLNKLGLGAKDIDNFLKKLKKEKLNMDEVMLKYIK